MKRFIKDINDNLSHQVVDFIVRNLRKKVDRMQDYLLISDSRSLSGIINEGFFDCIISSAALNDYVRINKSLAKIHDLLSPKGILVGHVETSEQFYDRTVGKYHFIIARILALFSFVFERVIPKLFGIRHLLGRFSIVRHHRLTKCEALGRLRYCGFEIIKLEEINNHSYFIARKGTVPMNGPPSDGVLIKIRKMGREGRTIHCYKLRTMHSYANYLHDYVLDNLKIDNNGKVVGDFRVPGWGKMLRKLWLDEMPQFINILKGELTFIGPRHLSREFLELYPEDWRKERMKLRPGFVPPYYADCPKSFEEIIESEKRYYELKKKHPVTTDIYYFMRVVISFLMMKARTG